MSLSQVHYILKEHLKLRKAKKKNFKKRSQNIAEKSLHVMKPGCTFINLGGSVSFTFFSFKDLLNDILFFYD